MDASQWVQTAIFGVFTALIVFLIKSWLLRVMSNNKTLSERVVKCEKDTVSAITIVDCEEKREKVLEEVKGINMRLYEFEKKTLEQLARLDEKIGAVVDKLDSHR